MGLSGDDGVNCMAEEPCRYFSIRNVAEKWVTFIRSTSWRISIVPLVYFNCMMTSYVLLLWMWIDSDDFYRLNFRRKLNEDVPMKNELEVELNKLTSDSSRYSSSTKPISVSLSYTLTCRCSNALCRMLSHVFSRSKFSKTLYSSRSGHESVVILALRGPWAHTISVLQMPDLNQLPPVPAFHEYESSEARHSAEDIKRSTVSVASSSDTQNF